MKAYRLSYLLWFALTLTAGCEKYDFTEDGTTRKEEEDFAPPTDAGKGTAEAPYTVEDLLSADLTKSGGACWVIGYVVGATYRTMNNAEFAPDANYSANVLLAGDSLCTSSQRCIPVELSSTSLQKKFALPHNPQGFRQCAMFYGKPARYFNVNGLRNISAGHWLWGFDIQQINPIPEEWNDTTISTARRQWR
ncbi:MAG: DUF6359 domain-containing protein [Bacteroidaceae bacterium]|nr:DUF6359 domain-containing protein [Bacteroidaceae bacterium]